MQPAGEATLLSLVAADQHRDSLAAADAQRHEAELVVARAPSRTRIFAVMTEPVAPTGWPSAIAPPFGLTLLAVEVEVLDHGERLGGERLVELDHVDVVERAAGALERLAHGGHRARCP